VTPDGRTALTGSGDQTAILWNSGKLLDLFVGGLTNRACAAAGGGLSPEQWEKAAPGIDYQNTCP
jgi:hypothetical protein